MLTRRQLIQASAAAGAGAFLARRFGGVAPRRAAAQALQGPLTPYLDALPIPPVLSTGQLAAGGMTMARHTNYRFHQSLGPAITFGYGGAPYLGPTIEAQRGASLTYTATNNLGLHPLGIDPTLDGALAGDATAPRAALHLHGGFVAADSDGGPEDTFAVGKAHTYTYPNDQQAGTIWYHDHAMGITRLNVYAGLAGFYWIRDAVDTGLPVNPLGLPAGPYEVPLVIQDKSFTTDGKLFYPNPWAPEFFGDHPVVNGKVSPYMNAERRGYRLRIVNGSGSRIYNLAFQNTKLGLLKFHLIGTDTGLVSKPVRLNQIVLAPGERIDILIDFADKAAGNTVTLANLPLPAGVVSPAPPGSLPALMQFRIAGAALPLVIPTALRPVSLLSAAGVPQRNVLLTEIMDPVTMTPVMALLNARRFDTIAIEKPKANTLEQWTIINLTADTHPIHLHLGQFQLLNRQGINAAKYLNAVFGTRMLTMQNVDTVTGAFPAPDAYVTGAVALPLKYEVGWKDTIQAHPGTVTRILVPFGGSAAAGVPFGQEKTFTGRYVWHCHILDHEDNEMMLPYEVV